MTNSFQYGIDRLTITNVLEIASGKLKAQLSDAAIQKINASQQHVQQIVANNQTVYGITTGFGALSNTKISEEDTRTLQHKILQSHSVGVGESVADEIVRLMMVTKVHALAQGYAVYELGRNKRSLIHLSDLINSENVRVVKRRGGIGHLLEAKQSVFA